MSYSSEATLHLIEALIEHLEAENVLTPESIGEIYDRALLLAQSETGSDSPSLAALRARLARLQRH